MRAFVPTLPSVVLVDFLHAGKQYKRGEAFPHAALKLGALELRGLWLARYIDFVAPDAVDATSPAPPKPAQQTQQHRR